MKLKQITSLAVLIFTIAFTLPFHLNLSQAQEPTIEVGSSRELPDVEREILWLARAVYSETKVREEQALVAWVIRNRVEAGFRGGTYQEVVLAPNQFSGLNPADPQYEINVSRDYEHAGEAWQSALAVARAVYSAPESLRPIPESVLHFYSPISVKSHPEWAHGEEAVLIIKSKTGLTPRFAFYDGIK